MKKMWREVLKHLIYRDSRIDGESYNQKNNERIDFDTESSEEYMTSVSSMNIADQRNNETNQLKVIDAYDSPCDSENLITVCDTDELNTSSSITESIAGLIMNLKTKINKKLARTCNSKIQMSKKRLSHYLRTISSNNDEISHYIKSYLKLLFYIFLKDLESGDDKTQESIETSLNELVKYILVVTCEVERLEGLKYFYSLYFFEESKNHDGIKLIKLIETVIATNKELIFFWVTEGEEKHTIHYITKWRPYFKDILGISQSFKDTCFISNNVQLEIGKDEILDSFFETFKVEEIVNKIVESINSSVDLLNESHQYLKIAREKETEANLKKDDNRENELYLNYNKTTREYFEYTNSPLDIDNNIENSKLCHTKIKSTGVLKILMLMNLVLEGGASNVENTETPGNNVSINANKF